MLYHPITNQERRENAARTATRFGIDHSLDVNAMVNDLTHAQHCITTLTRERDDLKREVEELMKHLKATVDQVQDNCWCAPGDKCPAHTAKEYLTNAAN